MSEEQGLRVITCHCGGQFQGVTSNDALGRFRTHMEEKHLEDDMLHWAESESFDPKTEKVAMTIVEMRNELQRLLDARAATEAEDWTADKEAQLFRTALHLTAVSNHVNHHDGEPEDFRHCRRWPCLYAAMVLPEIKEVQWREMP